MLNLVQKYRRRGILLDSNLLVVFLIGRYDCRHLINCPATKAFTPSDYDLLEEFVTRFDKLITTPHILTEVSNLAGRLPEGLLPEFRVMFREVIGTLIEQSMPSQQIANHLDFLRFGLTDTAISLVNPGSFLVLTGDRALYGLLQKKRVDAIYFTHNRTPAWKER